ncbi:hypothetical protein D3C73_1311190 [compost metagenome]
MRDEVRHAVDILDTVGRFVDAARLSFARALVGRVSGDGDVAFFGQALCVEAGHLLFHAAVRVRDDDGRVHLFPVVACRGIYVGGDFQAVQLIGDRMNVHLASFVPGNGCVVHQRERILFVVRSKALCRAACNGCQQGGFEYCLSHENFHLVWV